MGPCKGDISMTYPRVKNTDVTEVVRAEEIADILKSIGDERQARHLMRFFKTGKGDYGEGDRFLGLRCPQTRMVVREARLRVSFSEIERLLYSEWHEVRLAGFLLLVEEMKEALPRKRKAATEHASARDEIARFYLRHARQANNWDLVDMTCPKILGEWLLYPSVDGKLPDRKILDDLAGSDNLWEQRIGIVTTWRLIRNDEYDCTLRIAEKLLSHHHDLIHKATGWMLREVGKRDMEILTGFLNDHYKEMPRTVLRYAIEKMDERSRRLWLHKPLS